MKARGAVLVMGIFGGCVTAMPARPDQPAYFTASDLDSAKREEVGGRVQTLELEVVRNATIELLRDGRVLAAVTTDNNGRFMFPGRYRWGAGYVVQLISDDFTARMSLEIVDRRASNLEVLAAKRAVASSVATER